ncbi:MFS transporter [Gordonia sp. NPDC003424]
MTTERQIPLSSASPASSPPSRLPLLIACGAAFLAFLDLSVVNIAFPTIARAFPTTPTTTLTWVVSGYAVAFAALLTPAGRFADTLGRRRVLMLALAGFAITSLVCALAPDVAWLIAGRVLQGAFAALMIPAGLGLVLGNTVPERTGAAVAAWTAAGGFAATVGPALGGALIDAFGWRAVFFVNAPVAALLIATAMTIRDDARPVSRGLPDPVGTTAAVVGIGALVATVTEGQQWNWDWRAILCAAVGATALGVALYRSQHHPRPAVSVGLWRNSDYARSNATGFLFGTAMYAWLLAGPMWLDAVWHYSVLESAGAMTVGAIASMAAAVVAGRASEDRQRAAGVIGALLFAAATLYMSTDVWGVTPSFWVAWIPAGLLGGPVSGHSSPCSALRQRRTHPHNSSRPASG